MSSTNRTGYQVINIQCIPNRGEPIAASRNSDAAAVACGFDCAPEA